MSTQVFCAGCGQPIIADAKFCRHCGVPQTKSGLTVHQPAPTDLLADADAVAAAVAPETVADSETTQAPRTPWAETPPRVQAAASQAADRIEQTTPGMGELAGKVAAQLRTPLVASALTAAGLTFALMLAVGLVLALIPAGDSSFFVGADGGLISRTLFYAATLTAASAEVAGLHVQGMPMVFIAVPLGGMAIASYHCAERLAARPPWQRLAAGAAGAIPLAVLVAIIAGVGKISGEGLTAKPDVGAAFGLTLLWGVLGGLAGSGYALSRERPGIASAALPPGARPAVAAATATLRPLAIGLLLATVIGTGIVVVQTLTDQGGLKQGRSAIPAAIEDALYAPEHGLHLFALGSFVQFRTTNAESFGLPIPVARPDKVLDLDDGISTSDGGKPSATLRAFDYADALPAGIFLLGLLIAIAIPLLFALYAGFVAARAAGSTDVATSAAWGAITGPVWALILVVLEAVANKTDSYSLWGLAEGGSVFGLTLLVGAVAGAAGGALSATGRTTTVPSP